MLSPIDTTDTTRKRTKDHGKGLGIILYTWGLGAQSSSI